MPVFFWLICGKSYAKLFAVYTKNQISSTKNEAPIRSATRIVSALEQDILEGALVPGERLDEQLLAERFKVSRTPVREALMELTARGLRLR